MEIAVVDQRWIIFLFVRRFGRDRRANQRTAKDTDSKSACWKDTASQSAGCKVHSEPISGVRKIHPGPVSPNVSTPDMEFVTLETG